MAYTITPQRRAFLDTIGWAEGADYDIRYGGGTFNNYGPHPNTKITAGGYSSDACGKYQFLYNTWMMGINALGLPNIMSPENQDQVAIFLIDNRDALTDLDTGNIESTITKVSWEWASLPPDRYGQTRFTMDEVTDHYYAELGTGPGISDAGKILGSLAIVTMSYIALRSIL